MRLDQTTLLGLRAQFEGLAAGKETAETRKAINAALNRLRGKTAPKSAPDYLGAMTEMTSLAGALLGAVQITHPKPPILRLKTTHIVQLQADGRTFTRSSAQNTISLGAAIVDALIERNEREDESEEAEAEPVVAQAGNRPADVESGEPKTTPSRGSSRPTGFKPGAQARQAGSTTGSALPPGYKAPPSPRHV
jgi:hypothetical protein